MTPYDELFTLVERLKKAAEGIDASGIAGGESVPDTATLGKAGR